MPDNDRSIFEVSDREAGLHRSRDDVPLMGIRRTSSGDIAHIQFHTGDYLQYNRTTDVLTLYEGDAARIQFSVASAGNMLTTGYLRVGSLTAPTNVTAGDLTIVRLFVGNATAITDVEALITGDAVITSSLAIGAAKAASGFTFDVQGGDIRLGAAAGDNVQLAISTAHPATPASGFEWAYPFTTTGRDVPFWLDDGAFMFAAVEEAAVLIPRAVNLFTTNAIAGSIAASVAPTATSAHVGLVTVTSPIEVAQITYGHGGSGSANAVLRIAIYSDDGLTKFIDATDAVANAGAGLRTVNVTDTWLGPGNYYFFICLSSGTTAPSINVWDTITTFNTVASEPDLEGVLTVTGGAAPTTFDPVAITTPGADSTPIFRLDGTRA